MAVCSVIGCDGTPKARGWCPLHYERWRRSGDPTHVSQIRGDIEARFWQKVDKTDTCWLWTAHRLPDGYGRFQVDGRFRLAHRWAYEHFVGHIAEGLELDHLCRERSCVRPDHLEPVTHRVNVQRGVRSYKTHCPQGHEYAGDNLRINAAGYRTCKTCGREAVRRHVARQKAAA